MSGKILLQTSKVQPINLGLGSFQTKKTALLKMKPEVWFAIVLHALAVL